MSHYVFTLLSAQSLSDSNFPEAAYDVRGRVLTRTQTPASGSARVTQYTYTAPGDIASVTFHDGRRLSYTYDAARMVRRVTDNLGNYVAYQYDVKGNRTQAATYDPSNTLVRQLDMAFDLRNHVASINAGGSITQQLHDAVGNVTAQTDPNNNPATTNSFDALSRLLKTVNSLGGVTGYGYDSNDQVTQVASPNGASTQYCTMISVTSSKNPLPIEASPPTRMMKRVM